MSDLWPAFERFWGADWSGAPFRTFGPAHVLSLLVVAVMVVATVRVGKRWPGARPGLRWGIAGGLWANELAYHLWRLTTGSWTLQTMLPLHLCALMVWLGGLMVITRNRRIYPFVYFLGLAGATQALLTPDPGPYGFPHFRAFQTMASHGLIVLSALWMTFVEGLRTTWRQMWTVLGVTCVWAVAVFGVNSALGSNYLYVNGKPETASLLDALPAWPGYLPFLLLIAVVLCVLLQLPWALRTRTATDHG